MFFKSGEKKKKIYDSCPSKRRFNALANTVKQAQPAQSAHSDHSPKFLPIIGFLYVKMVLT